jgi:hypothetical protein
MKDTSPTTKSKPSRAWERARRPAQVRGRSRPRCTPPARSWLMRGCTCAWPTSMPTTSAAPCCSRQSVKPPVLWPDVQATQPVHLHARGLQGPFELEATARDITRLGIVEQLQCSAFGHFVAVFQHRTPNSVGLLPLHAPGDQALGLGTGSGQTAFDKELINAHSGGISARVNHTVRDG